MTSFYLSASGGKDFISKYFRLVESTVLTPYVIPIKIKYLFSV